MSKILIIEDDHFLGELYRFVLSDAGYSVLLSTDAQDGVDQLDEYGADLILLDLMLPAHNGVEFLQELQSQSDWQTIPTVILSAQKISQADKKHFGKFGVIKVLDKTDITPKDLIKEVRQILNNETV